MSKYKATSTIIALGKILYIIIFAAAALNLLIYISNWYPGGVMVSVGLVLNGFLIMFFNELLSIFRDIAENTSKTNELLEKKKH